MMTNKFSVQIKYSCHVAYTIPKLLIKHSPSAFSFFFLKSRKRIFLFFHIFQKMSDGLEIHSILEFGDEPVQGLWWVLSPSGESPPIRAGAASLIVANEERPELDERILITGGATPDGFIDNCVELNLFTGAWKPLVSTDFVARYEHAMIAAEDNKTPTVLLGSSNSESLQETG